MRHVLDIDNANNFLGWKFKAMEIDDISQLDGLKSLEEIESNYNTYQGVVRGKKWDAGIDVPIYQITMRKFLWDGVKQRVSF